MIKLKDLKKHYNVFKNNKEYRLYSIEENSLYATSKYIATLEKSGIKYKVKTSKYFPELIFSLRNNLEDLLKDIEILISNYKYPSEIYDELFRDGYFEVQAINYDLNKIGFKQFFIQNSFLYKLETSNLIGQKSDIIIDFKNLEVLPFDKPKEFVTIRFIIDDYSWIEIENVKRDVDTIMSSVHEMLKNIKLKETADNISFLNTLKNGTIPNVSMKIANGLDISLFNYKETLISKLEEALNKLKTIS